MIELRTSKFSVTAESRSQPAAAGRDRSGHSSFREVLRELQDMAGRRALLLVRDLQGAGAGVAGWVNVGLTSVSRDGSAWLISVSDGEEGDLVLVEEDFRGAQVEAGFVEMRFGAIQIQLTAAPRSERQTDGASDPDTW